MEDIRTEELMNEVTNEAVENAGALNPSDPWYVLALKIIGMGASVAVGAFLAKKIWDLRQARKIESEQADDFECVEVEAVEIEEAE